MRTHPPLGEMLNHRPPTNPTSARCPLRSSAFLGCSSLLPGWAASGVAPSLASRDRSLEMIHRPCQSKLRSHAPRFSCVQPANCSGLACYHVHTAPPKPAKILVPRSSRCPRPRAVDSSAPLLRWSAVSPPGPSQDSRHCVDCGQPVLTMILTPAQMHFKS